MGALMFAGAKFHNYFIFEPIVASISGLYFVIIADRS